MVLQKRKNNSTVMVNRIYSPTHYSGAMYSSCECYATKVTQIIQYCKPRDSAERKRLRQARKHGTPYAPHGTITSLPQSLQERYHSLGTANRHIVDTAMATLKNLPKHRAEIELQAYNTKQWEHSYASERGGFVATERKRIAEGERNTRERAVFKKELAISKVLADHGYKVQYLSGANRQAGQTYDILMDGIPTDLKSISTSGNLVKQIKHALRDQGASAVVVRLENDIENKLYEKLKEARRKTKGKIYFYRLEKPENLFELTE